MTLFITIAVLALLGAVGVLAALAHRRRLARREARRREIATRLRAVAIDLVDGEVTPVPRLSAPEALVFADLLVRYARGLRGQAHERIAAYFEDTGAVDREVRHLGSRRERVRVEAAFGLGDMGSARAVPALLAALEDRSVDVRAAATRSLGRIGATEAVEPVIAASVAQRLPRAVAGAALLEIGSPAVGQLLVLLGHEDPHVRADAAELVGLLGAANDADALPTRLRDASPDVRAASAVALGRLGSADARDQLVATLSDRVPFVRASAARALGQIGGRTATAALLDVARRDEFDPAAEAARALARIDPALVITVAAQSDASQHLVEAADRLLL
ncbi:HEAT repeat domain-containing protein [Cellulomonas edaphi]|uniref:HEAT repeat domain-containing protein n=1 Tax=Cellulomonas edaphi TaxID=3053468 RepID=A0ABT7S6K9_9CELL|nr:HEAT repeat domain-containing protein [Cellulomons edaphi]MDM7830599.1 HEAT repeat domain-containing protein [Cellulomons edaphi]